MYILNYILLASGILFLIAMTLICLALFWVPRRKQQDSEFEYSPVSHSSGRHIIDADEYEDTEAEEEAGSDERSVSDELKAESEEQGSTDEPEVTDDAEDDGSEKPESGDSEDIDEPEKAENTEAKPNGIEICVTVIDTNKKNHVTVEDEILIGRSPKCDVVINKPMVSSAHCILVRDGKKLMAEDNNSTNGTMLNGKPLNHLVELKNNDVLTLGDRSVRINFVN